MQTSATHHDGKVTVDVEILNQISKVVMDGHQKSVAIEIDSSAEMIEDGALTADPYSEMDADGEEELDFDSESQSSLQARLSRTVLFPSGAKNPRGLKGPFFRNASIGHRKAHRVPVRRVAGKVNLKLQTAEHKKVLKTLQEQSSAPFTPVTQAGAMFTPTMGTTELIGGSI